MDSLIIANLKFGFLLDVGSLVTEGRLRIILLNAHSQWEFLTLIKNFHLFRIQDVILKMSTMLFVS